MEYRNLNDKELVEKVAGNDLAAFKILFDRYQKKIYNMIYYMIYDREATADLTQDTFVKAYNSVKKLKKKEMFSSWLYRIGVNNTRNYLKKHSRVETIELNTMIPDDKNKTVETMESKELQQHLNIALKALKDKHREVVILHHIKGFDVKEISEILKVPAGTVKSRLARAREKLKTLLREYVLEGELV